MKGRGGRSWHRIPEKTPSAAGQSAGAAGGHFAGRFSLVGQYLPAGDRADPVFSDLPAGFDGCRIAVLSDLHSASFGPNNQTLFETVARQQPDYIFYLGDLEDQYRGRKPEYVAEVADGLTAIAPTYYVTGNHEWAIGRVPELKEGPRRSRGNGALQPVCDAGRGGDTVVLAGIDDPNGYADQKTPEELAAEVYAACGDPFWMLLAHRNDHFSSQYSLLGADLVLSGHGHGGLIRLPFTDGLFSHDWDLFPSNTAGLYEENGSCQFVTRGWATPASPSGSSTGRRWPW